MRLYNGLENSPYLYFSLRGVVYMSSAPKVASLNFLPWIRSPDLAHCTKWLVSAENAVRTYS
jgi:hypothetical protein